jgi:hypothetical protein
LPSHQPAAAMIFTALFSPHAVLIFTAFRGP